MAGYLSQRLDLWALRRLSVQTGMVGSHILFDGSGHLQRQSRASVSRCGSSEHESAQRIEALVTRPIFDREDVEKGGAEDAQGPRRWRGLQYRHDGPIACRLAESWACTSRSECLTLVLRHRCMLAANMTFLAANRWISISSEGKEVAFEGMRERQCKNAMRFEK
jgi:hypothetical protein